MAHGRRDHGWHNVRQGGGYAKTFNVSVTDEGIGNRRRSSLSSSRMRAGGLPDDHPPLTEERVDELVPRRSVRSGVARA
jgi:hypothetical protein